MSVAKEPPFAGIKSYTGKVYQTSSWPSENVDLQGKRIAVVGTGATGVQIIPKLAMVAKELTVFQRTPNYVLPGRNYTIDDSEAANIKKSYEDTWHRASTHPFGLAMNATGKTAKDLEDANNIRQVLDAGWETGGFHFQFETLDDIFTSQESNDVASEYIRQKIHAIVKDHRVAHLLSPKYPFLSKRPPCGHFYYETYNRPNVRLVDISRDDISLYESGIRTESGSEYDFDVIIFALGFDAATGALSEIDVTGSNGKTLRDTWTKNLETFAGVLLPGFPNMFVVCGPHVPFGNMPVVLDIEASWIGKTIRHMEENGLARIDVSEAAVHEWTSHLDQAFRATLFAESAKASGAWFVGANIPGKASAPLFYFGGIPTWTAWLENECKTAWARMNFVDSRTVTDTIDKDSSDKITHRMASDVASIA